MRSRNPRDRKSGGLRTFGWRGHFQPNWGQAALAMGLIGLGLAVWAGKQTAKKREQLRSWPIVTAQVDSGMIVTPQRIREDVYTIRYWLRFPWHGIEHTLVTTPSILRGDYRSRWRALQSTRRSGVISALVNPQNPDDLKFDAGWNGRFFLVPLILGGISLVFLAFSALFYWFGRRLGMDQSAAASFPLPPTLGIWIGASLGVVFLCVGSYAFYSRSHQQSAWRKLEAKVDSADVVRASTKNSTTYSPRYWLSYAFNDTTFHSPLAQSWSTIDYYAEARRAANAARVGRMTIFVNRAEPLDVATNTPGGVQVVIVFLWFFFTCFCFGLAFLFYRARQRERPAVAAKARPGR